MYCWNCGTEIPDDSIYCKHCGAEINNSLPNEQTISTGVKQGIKKYEEEKLLQKEQEEKQRSKLNAEAFLSTQGLILSFILFIILWVGPLTFFPSLIIFFVTTFVLTFINSWFDWLFSIICSLAWGFLGYAISAIFTRNGPLAIPIGIIVMIIAIIWNFHYLKK